MNQHDNLINQIRQMLDKARRSLNAARRNLNEGDYDFAASRAYYAVFYCMEAVLLTKNLTFSKHTGLIRAFNLYFIKEDIFPREIGKYIHRLFRERHIGDYSLGLSISESDAETDIGIAEEMVRAMMAYLKKEGYAELERP